MAAEVDDSTQPLTREIRPRRMFRQTFQGMRRIRKSVPRNQISAPRTGASELPPASQRPPRPLMTLTSLPPAGDTHRRRTGDLYPVFNHSVTSLAGSHRRDQGAEPQRAGMLRTSPQGRSERPAISKASITKGNTRRSSSPQRGRRFRTNRRCTPRLGETVNDLLLGLR
jgi:hypothetical protein